MNCLKYVHSDITPEVYRGGGGGVSGIVSKVAEVATGGLIKSKATKEQISAANRAQAEQAKILKQQKAELEEEEAQRKARIGRTRQGRRSLLYAGGDEAGVTKSTTLGG